MAAPGRGEVVVAGRGVGQIVGKGREIKVWIKKSFYHSILLLNSQ